MKRRIHFITYGDSKFANSKERINQQAADFEPFSTIKIYGPENLDKEFKSKVSNTLRRPRGGGYYIWKPYVVKKRYDEIEVGDYMVFLDSGCTLNKTGLERFNQYLDILDKSGSEFLGFHMSEHLEKTWTKQEIFDYFQIRTCFEIALSA